MAAGTFLWPRPNVRRALFSAPANIVALERQLMGMFDGGCPVLFSSGRAALTAAIAHFGLGRADVVGIFPYASHCVVDAVARLATPEVNPAAPRARVVYHQLGFVQERGLDEAVIEDAVDSLCIPGTRLHPGGAGYELWSFPKIAGTLGGAVIWCRREHDANALAVLRDRTAASNVQWLLRALGTAWPRAHLWWQGAESSLGRPTAWQLGEIRHALAQWPALVQRRQDNLAVVRDLLPSWLSVAPGRLPTAVPVETEAGESIASEFHLTAGLRHVERIDPDGSRRLERLLPIPIHQDLSVAQLAAIRRKVAGSGRSP
jgi:putative PLP-dependent aminotransferase (TIGR04422 family)